LNYRKKLIEVALPLDDINTASAREKSIRHGHPSTLHLWWARRPLAAARAVIFGQMVDDPSTYVNTLRQDKKLVNKANRELNKRMKLWELAEKDYKLAQSAGVTAPEPGPKPELDEILAEIERERLFKIISELVIWENTTNEEVLEKARTEIWQSWRRACADNVDHPRAKELFDRDKLPAFHDPFAGGGSLPLEAQRLGLEAYASDLNPVAVLINKAMIEIPPIFAGMPPVNPEAREKMSNESWKGAAGLAEDVRYYGKWMRDEAEKRIGHLYPKVKITEEMISDPLNPRPDLKQYLGRELTVIAWIWARTVKSPNPAFAHVDVPLVGSFSLHAKKGSAVWIDAVKNADMSGFEFKIRFGSKTNAKGTITKTGGTCLISGSPITFEYIRSEAKAGRMSERLIAIVAYDGSKKVFLNPLENHDNFIKTIKKVEEISGDIPKQALGIRVQLYGINDYSMLFNNRQFLFIYTLCDIVSKLGKELSDDPGYDKDYIKAIQTYLALAIGRYSDYGSTMTYWDDRGPSIQKTFGLPTLQMRWSYPETNPFENFSGSIDRIINSSIEAIKSLSSSRKGSAMQEDAISAKQNTQRIFSTDPPYYDNIGYAALSDYFYMWLKLTLKEVYPELFSTILTPKANELIAEPGRHNSKHEASIYFENSFNAFLKLLYGNAHHAYPVTIYYAFKQSEIEKESGNVVSTGWEVFIEGLVKQKWHIVGTWPIRTEQKGGLRIIGRNSLASSIVLVCHRRPPDAPTTTRRDFINSLKSELPLALAHLQRSNIAPVDLAQAAIGPGMAVYTRYESVLETDGSKVGVREALSLINQVLDEVLAEQEGDFDADTRWALAWFEQFGFNEGEYGVAETLSKAKNTSIDGLVEAGILFAKGGKVRLLKPAELPDDWDPLTEKRLTVWEIVHHLVRSLEQGENAAAELIAKLGVLADSARELTYRLYMICERKKWAQEALAYNGLVQSWPEMVNLAREFEIEEQPRLF
jgi:putative DNA methylase